MNPEYRISTEKQPGQSIAVVEFTREQLEDLVRLYGPNDVFTEDVRNVMRWIDQKTDMP